MNVGILLEDITYFQSANLNTKHQTEGDQGLLKKFQKSL